ncbi:MAG: 4-hydroxyphenylacetate 3-hydroxylase N-terminal domain-containing protein [Rhodospirillales bacterium]|nr:4-hydroxyphenylacetate 3-hydroxylase N-terminal domain-containing protein [Rhodospirillales bacterium]
MPDETAAKGGNPYTSETPKGILDGKRYLESLRDDRVVFYQGERIKDVTKHPLFAGMAQTLADIYDKQHDPEFQDIMTYVEDNGLRVSTSYLRPTKKADLETRHRNTQFWSRQVHGMCGRLPDFCAAMTIGYVDIKDDLAELNPDLAANTVAYYEHARDHDVCLSHALHDPCMDKSLRPSEDPDRCVRVIKERDDGIIVRGARFNTLGPFSNDILISPTYAFTEDEAEFALWFMVPVDAPGLSQICREIFSGRSPLDHPMSSRFDEIDTLVVFDDVFIPWERLFLYREPLAANRLFRSGVMSWAGDCSSTLTEVRFETLATIGHMLAVTSGIEERPHVQQALGEMCTYLTLLRNAIRAGHVDCHKTKGGHYAPAAFFDRRSMVTRVSERFCDLVEHIGTSSTIFTHSAEDWDNPEIKKYLDTYMRGHNTTPLDRHKICKLAWELTGDSYGRRQQLYERLHSGDAEVVKAGPGKSFDFAPGLDRLGNLLGLDGSVPAA